MRAGIYQITNTVNGKTYIGSSVDIPGRHKNHRTLLRRGKHHNPHLQAAWNKYGKGAFTFEVLCYRRPEDLLVFEQMFLDVFRPAYNMLKIAGAPTGRRHTEETKQKLRRLQQGRVHSEATRANMSAAQKQRAASPEVRAQLIAMSAKASLGWQGKHHTDETKAKLSEAKRGRGNPKCRGRRHTDEEKIKMSAAQKARAPFTEEHLENLSKSHMNPSAEIRQRMSDSHKGKPWTPAQREAYERRKAVIS